MLLVNVVGRLRALPRHGACAHTMAAGKSLSRRGKSLAAQPLQAAIRQGRLCDAQELLYAGLDRHKVWRPLLKLAKGSSSFEDLAWMQRMVVDKEMVRKAGLEPDAFDYYQVIVSLCLHGQMAQAERVVQTMEARGIPRTALTTNALLSGYKRRNEVGKARVLLEATPSDQLDIVSYNTVLAMLTKNQEVDAAMQLYRQLPKMPDRYTYATMLHIATQTHNAPFGTSILPRLLFPGAKIDATTLNTALAFQINVLGAWDDALDLVEKHMHVAGDATRRLLQSSDPSLSTHGRALAMASRIHGNDYASKPDASTFSLLVSMHAHTNQLGKALDKMIAAIDTVQPDDQALSVMMGNLGHGAAMVSSKDVERAMTRVDQSHPLSLKGNSNNNEISMARVLAFLVSPPVPLSTMVYNAFLHRVARQGRVDLAQWVYDRIFRKDIQRVADVVTYTHLAAAYIRAGQPDEAMAMYYVLRDRHPDPIELDVRFYTIVINALTRVATPQLDSALQLFADMRQLRVQPNNYTYTSLLHACAHAGDADGLATIHRLLKMDMQLDPDVRVYNALMNGYSRTDQLDQVLFVWDTLLAERKFDAASVAIVLDACGHNGAYRRGVAIWHLLRDLPGFVLNTNHHNSYIEFLCRVAPAEDPLGRWMCAADVIGEMHASASPDAKTYNTLASFARKYDIRSHPLVNQTLDALSKSIKK